MSGTKQTEFTVSGQSVDLSNPDAARVYIERIVEPILKKVRNTVNQLARDVMAISASGGVDAKYGMVLVDASHGPVTLTLVPPSQNFHPITVVKTDSSANAVVVQARGGALISGAGTDTFSKQWEVVQYESDDFKYVRTFGGNMSLFGDVTGRADSNTLSMIQGFTLTASGGNAPTTGQVLMYDGTKWLPISRNMRTLDASYSPVGCWSFNVVTTTNPIPDLSGNGFDLFLETGTTRGTQIHPTLGATYFDGATSYRVTSPQAALQITSDLTVIVQYMYSDNPAPGTTYTLYSHGDPGETSDVNVLYLGNVDQFTQFNYFSEHGAGIDDPAGTLSSIGKLFPALMGLTRDSSGSLKFWSDGLFRGSPFGTVTLPTDGHNGHFRVGVNNNSGNYFTGIMGSIAVYNKVLTDAQMLERYNFTMGGAYGLR